MSITKIFNFIFKKGIANIIIPIAMSVIMVLFCFIFIDYVKNQNINEAKELYQNLDIVIYNDEGLSNDQLKEIQQIEKKSYAEIAIVPTAIRVDSSDDLNSYSYYNVEIIDYNEYSKLKELDSADKLNDGVIIMEYVNSKLSLNDNEKISIVFDGKEYEAEVVEVVGSDDVKGRFDADILMSREYLKKITGNINLKNNGFALDVNKDYSVINFIQESDILSKCVYKEYISEYEEDVNNEEYFIISLYTIVAIGVICVFSITKNAFHKFIMDNLNVITLLKSLGISRKDEKKLIRSVLMIISLIGWFFGFIIGIVIINTSLKIAFDIDRLYLPDYLCVIISLLIVILPLMIIYREITRALAKMNIVELLKGTNNTNEIEKFNIKKMLIRDTVFVGLIIGAKMFLTTNPRTWVYVGVSIFDMVMLSMLVCDLSLILINKLLDSGNILVKALYVNKKKLLGMITSITLSIMLFTGMLGVFDNISKTFIDSLKDTMSYDYEVYLNKETEDTKIKEVLDKAVGGYAVAKTSSASYDGFSLTLEQIDIESMKKIYGLKYAVPIDDVKAEMEKDKKMIIASDRLMQRFGLSIGDHLELDINNIKETYTIIDTCNYIGYRIFACSEDNNIINRIMIADSQISANKLAEILNNSISEFNVISVSEILKNETKHINRNLRLFLTMSLAVVSISLVIMLNTIKASLQEHKHDLAVLNTLGIKGTDKFKLLSSRIYIYTFVCLVSGSLAAFEFIKMSSKMMGKILYVEVVNGINFEKSFISIGLIGVLLLLMSLLTITFGVLKNKDNIISTVKE